MKTNPFNYLVIVIVSLLLSVPSYAQDTQQDDVPKDDVPKGKFALYNRTNLSRVEITLPYAKSRLSKNALVHLPNNQKSCNITVSASGYTSCTIPVMEKKRYLIKRKDGRLYVTMVN